MVKGAASERPFDADATALTAGQRRRSLAVAMASAAAAGLTIGLTVPLLALILEHDGVDTTLIGLNSAMAALAIVVSAPFTPRLVRRFGTLPSMYLGIALAVVAILLLAVFRELSAWFVLRFVVGLGMAVHWVVGEAWINAVAGNENRGRVIGLYATVLSAGFATGPLVVAVVGIEGVTPFLASAGLLALGALPLLFARGVAPPMAVRTTTTLAQFFRHAPTTLAAALAAGFSDSALFALLPLYSLHSGFDQATAVTMLSVFVAGNLALQLPIGWLADRIDRRLLLMVCAAVGVVGPVLLPFVIDVPLLVWPVLFIWGGTIEGLYTVGLTLLGERFELGDLAGANAAFVMIYSAGGVAGPSLAGGAMDVWDPHGLSLVVALAGAAFLAVVVVRRARARE
ncbi:MAG: MFS transporter [Alphaproteobacteria bacterium]